MKRLVVPRLGLRLNCGAVLLVLVGCAASPSRSAPTAELSRQARRHKALRDRANSASLARLPPIRVPMRRLPPIRVSMRSPPPIRVPMRSSPPPQLLSNRGDLEAAKKHAANVLAARPSHVRALRIVVTVACLEGDASTAKSHYVKLPARDREHMKARCQRYGIEFPGTGPLGR
jgi:hypothetical protein